MLSFGLGVVLSVSVFASNQVEPTFKDWKLVKRTTEKIALIEKDVVSSGKDFW